MLPLVHLYERDVRRDEPDFNETCGSFSVIQKTLEIGLRQLNCYTDNPQKADFIGISDSLALDFSWPDKKTFVIAFIDHINTISYQHYFALQRNPNVRIFTLHQCTANLFKKVNKEAYAIGAGINVDYWIKTKPYNETFSFLSTGFSNYRSGIDQLIPAFDLAFRNFKNVQLIIKDTNSNPQFAEKIKEYQDRGNNIVHINKRLRFSEIRDLYSQSQVSCNVLRHSSHGLPLIESSLCGSLCFAGDFDPSNQLADERYCRLIKPDKEVTVQSRLDNLLNDWGLYDTFGQLKYFEPPTFWEFDLHIYAAILVELYNNWNSYYKDLNKEGDMRQRFNPIHSAKKLVSYLSF